MTLEKMARLLRILNTGGQYKLPNGHIGHTYGGELSIEFTEKLEPFQHDALIRMEFVLHAGVYHYRPRKRS